MVRSEAQPGTSRTSRLKKHQNGTNNGPRPRILHERSNPNKPVHSSKKPFGVSGTPTILPPPPAPAPASVVRPLNFDSDDEDDISSAGGFPLNRYVIFPCVVSAISYYLPLI